MRFILNENLNYDLESDITLITELTGVSEKDLESFIDTNSIEDVYEYAWGNNIRINDIKWQEYKDLDEQGTLFLCHGSRSGIKGNIRLDVSGESNDFGNGFYCGTMLKQAGMFVAEEPNSSIYIVSFVPEGLKHCAFRVDTDWMLAVAYYRDRLNQYKNSERLKGIIEKVEDADYIVAPIADNRIFELIDAFIDGDITDKQCLYALSATYLGRQFVFKKDACLDKLDIVDHLYLCQSEKDSYAIQNSVESNTSLNKAIIAKKRFSNEGEYIDEILEV